MEEAEEPETWRVCAMICAMINPGLQKYMTAFQDDTFECLILLGGRIDTRMYSQPWKHLKCAIQGQDHACKASLTSFVWADKRYSPREDELPAVLRGLPVSWNFMDAFNARVKGMDGMHMIHWDPEAQRYMMPLEFCRNCKQRTRLGGRSPQTAVQFHQVMENINPRAAIALARGTNTTWPQCRRAECMSCRTQPNEEATFTVLPIPWIWGVFSGPLAGFSETEKVEVPAEYAAWSNQKVRVHLPWTMG
jgi:hypothetical protein